MNGLRGKLWAKILGFILFAVFAAAAAAAGIGIGYASSNGYYGGGTADAGYSFFMVIYALRWWFVAIFAAAAALMIADFVFLLNAAGHDESEAGIHLTWFDRAPLDFVWASLLWLSFVMVRFASESFSDFGHFDGVLFSAAAIAVAVESFLGAFYTFSARAKAGKWWRNTAICFVLHLAWKLLRAAGRGLVSAFRALPEFWRFALGYAAYLILNLLAVLNMSGGTFFFLVMLGADVTVGCVVLRGLSQYRKLAAGAAALAQGDLSAGTDTSGMYRPLASLGESLNSAGAGMAKAVEQQMKSERLKTELITNVSHDIKTPLTSIVSYVDLLQRPHTPEQEKEYLEVLARQSARLKRLTVDLVEASKASTGNIAVALAPTDLGELIGQALGEYSEKLAAAQLEPVFAPPSPPASVMADGRLLWRVLDNLLSNACKYSLPGTRIYLDVSEEEKVTVISLKNISRDKLNIAPDELMERFVRGDSARAGDGGSGLGLNIAKSLTELQHGTLTLSIDGDLFKASVALPKAPPQAAAAEDKP